MPLLLHNPQCQSTKG